MKSIFEKQYSSISSLPWEKKSVEEKKHELKEICEAKHQISYHVEGCIQHELSKIEGQKKITEQVKQQLEELKEGSVGQAVAIESSLIGSSPSDRQSIRTILISGKISFLALQK